MPSIQGIKKVFINQDNSLTKTGKFGTSLLVALGIIGAAATILAGLALTGKLPEHLGLRLFEKVGIVGTSSLGGASTVLLVGGISVFITKRAVKTSPSSEQSPSSHPIPSIEKTVESFLKDQDKKTFLSLLRQSAKTEKIRAFKSALLQRAFSDILKSEASPEINTWIQMVEQQFGEIFTTHVPQMTITERAERLKKDTKEIKEIAKTLTLEEKMVLIQDLLLAQYMLDEQQTECEENFFDGTDGGTGVGSFAAVDIFVDMSDKEKKTLINEFTLFENNKIIKILYDCLFTAQKMHGKPIPDDAINALGAKLSSSSQKRE